jgi:hypothetical protein
MYLKYNEGDLLINTTSGCLLLVTDGENGQSRWLTGAKDQTAVFYTSITPNTWNLYEDYNDGELKVLGNLYNLSKQFMQEKEDGVS